MRQNRAMTYLEMANWLNSMPANKPATTLGRKPSHFSSRMTSPVHKQHYRNLPFCYIQAMNRIRKGYLQG